MKLSRAMVKFPAGETESTLRTRAGLSGTEFKSAMAALLDDDQAEEWKFTRVTAGPLIPDISQRIPTHEGLREHRE